MAEINQQELRQLLLKEQAGKLSSYEREMLDNWYNSLDLTHQNLSLFHNKEHEEQFRQRLFDRIIYSGFSTQIIGQVTSSYNYLLNWISAVAILIILIGATLFWNLRLNSGNKELWLATQTGKGTVKKIKMEDGSLIWLNADSRLRYPINFGPNKREVYLEGEAYFDIAHDAGRPFTVKTDFLTTNVLGTAFSVTAYKNIPLRAVTVTRGNVKVAHGKQILGFLTPNKRIEYHVNDGKTNLLAIDASVTVSWKNGKLQFTNQNMQDIAGRLSRWYGYSFDFEHNTITKCQYTASFNSRIPLTNLLKVMKAISLVDYRIDTVKKVVTFLGSGCNE